MKALLLPPQSSDPFLAKLAPALEADGVILHDLVTPGPIGLLSGRIRGANLLYLHQAPAVHQGGLRALVRWSRVLRIPIVWNIGTALPRTGRAEDVENLRILYRAARVRIVSSDDVRERLRDDFGLEGTTFVVPPTEPVERIAEGIRTALETSLEAPMPVHDRTRPPRA